MDLHEAHLVLVKERHPELRSETLSWKNKQKEPEIAGNQMVAQELPEITGDL